MCVYFSGPRQPFSTGRSVKCKHPERWSLGHCGRSRGSLRRGRWWASRASSSAGGEVRSSRAMVALGLVRVVPRSRPPMGSDSRKRMFLRTCDA